MRLIAGIGEIVEGRRLMLGVILAELVPPAGLEPTHLAPEASALSAELRGHTPNIAVGGHYNNKHASS